MSSVRKIFVSYHSSDRAVAQVIVKEIKNAGLNVWWDQDLHGQDLTIEILRRINAADVVLILVSRNWLASDWCKGEAEAANGKRRIAVLEKGLIDILPPPFRARNVLDLIGYRHGSNDPRLAKVLEACALPNDAQQEPSAPFSNQEECSPQSRPGSGTDGNARKIQVVNLQGDNTGTINFSQDN